MAARDRTATAVAQRWSERDARAAADWATALPPGSLRDAALTGTMLTSDELPDASTLRLFRSDEARQTAILNVVSRSAQQNLDDAREMVRQQVDDPVIRARAEQLFEKMKSSPGY